MTAVQVAAVVAAGVAAYSNTFSVPFQFDDLTFIARNPSVRDLHTFLNAPQDPGRVVAFFTFALNGSIAGGSVAGYHAVNLAIHLATALCVYVLGAVLVPRMMRAGPGIEGSSQLAGFIAALLFVAHPIQTQAVTYIYQRLASLAALFYLAAVVTYGFAVTSERRGRKAALFALALLLTALALLTKQNAATLALSVVLLDVCFLSGRTRARLLRIAPFFVLTASVLTASAVVQDSAPAGVATNVSQLTAATMKLGDGGWVQVWTSYLLTQPRVVVTYLRLLLLPVDQNLDYDYPVYSSLLAGPVVLSAAMLGAVLGGGAIVAWRARRRSGVARVILFGIGWFAVALSVESVVPLRDVIVEYRLYLPSVGPFAIVGFGIAALSKRLGRRARLAAMTAVGASVLALTAATHARNEIWRDPLALWTDVVRKSPGKARPQYWLAQVFLERGEPERALPLLERAAVLDAPPQVYVSLGVTYANLGRVADAERAYRHALELRVLTPEGKFRVLPGVHVKLAALLLGSGRVGEACEHFASEAASDPANRDAVGNLVPCRFAQRDVAGAVSLAEKLVAEDPNDAQALCNLGRGYAWLGDVARARDAYRRFLAVAGPDMEDERAAALRWITEHPVSR